MKSHVMYVHTLDRDKFLPGSAVFGGSDTEGTVCMYVGGGGGGYTGIDIRVWQLSSAPAT